MSEHYELGTVVNPRIQMEDERHDPQGIKATWSLAQDDRVEWISVDDKLPEPDMIVLILTTNRNRRLAKHDPSTGVWTRDNGWTSVRSFRVTHWMPLPDLP